MPPVSEPDRRGPRRSRFITSVLVVVVGALITLSCVVGARRLNDGNEDRLLRQRVREGAAVAVASLPAVQVPLSSAAVLAEASNRVPSHAQLSSLMKGQAFTSVSIWPARSLSPKPLAVVGRPPKLASQPRSQVRAFLNEAAHSSTFVVNTSLLGQPNPVLGYAWAATSNPHYVAYGEVPPNRLTPIESDSSFKDVNYAVYLGSEADPAHLVASNTGGAPVRGRTASAMVPFGNTSLLVEMSPRGQLGGMFLSQLWWLLALMGFALTVAAAALVEGLIVRGREAEKLANENAELYAAQRSVAQTLQHSLMAEDLPHIPGIELAARYVAGVEGIDIGGDWYDVITLSPNRILIAVGDVSGRGLTAATMMASLRFAIRAYATQGDAPATILTKLSDLVDLRRDGNFATALCATIDLDDHVVRCANAGHPEPLLVAGDGTRYLTTNLGVPVGLREKPQYAEIATSLPPDSTLLFYTDGLIERRNETLLEGRDRLAQAAVGAQGSLESMLSAIVDDVIPNGSPDDTALLGVRWSR